MKKTAIIFFSFVFGLLSSGVCTAEADTKKVLYADSYHPQYPPNVAARKAFADRAATMDIEIRYEYMDAKRKKAAWVWNKSCHGLGL